MPAFRDMTPGESLDHFHQRCVLPSQEETSSRNAEIDNFVRFLHARFNTPPNKLARVLKGGSLGKGTAVRGSADIDLVVVLNGLSSIGYLKAQRTRLLDWLEQEVVNHSWQGRIAREGRTPFALQYTLNKQEVDVLPALDYVGVYGSAAGVYNEMSRTSGSEIGKPIQFSASLAPLQIEFVKPVDESVKRVIRLLKYWKKEKGVDIRSYTLELLTIHAARTSGWGQNTLTLFKAVLTMLRNWRSLKVAFNDNYDSSQYTGRLQAPYVLDPANPYMDTFYGKDAISVSAQARAMLDQL